MSAPSIKLLNGPLAPPCRICDGPAVLVNRPSGSGEAYHYCAKCVNAALERYDLMSAGC